MGYNAILRGVKDRSQVLGRLSGEAIVIPSPLERASVPGNQLL